MRVIAEGKESIVKLWGNSNPQDTDYRLMRYIIRKDCDHGTVLLNLVTGELIFLEPDEAGMLDILPMHYTSGMGELIAKHFLVPVTFDDSKGVNQLRSILRKATSGNAITSYSILPTTACNARCFYCYESSYPKLNMTSETADKVVEFMAAHCGSKKRVLIEWFGGEPTLGANQIDQICDGLIKRGIDYTSFTLSNGYLFTKDLARKAKEKWHLKKAQITMDGTEDVYNKAKAYVNVKGSPYQRVLENIGHLLDEGIQVIVRMNLDSRNENDLKALIDELILRFGKYDGFTAYVHEVFEDMGYLPVNRSEEERHNLIARKVSLNQYITNSGCRFLGSLITSEALPSLKISYCMADNPRSLLINPLGQFGKCDHYSFEHLVGSIENDCVLSDSEMATWLEPDYNEWCEKCCLFPMCGRPTFCCGKRECYSEEVQGLVQDLQLLMQKKYTRE